MRIALCTEVLYPIYGVERRVYEMAKRLPKFGVEVDVFTSTAQRYVKDIKNIQVSAPTITHPPKRDYRNVLKFSLSLYRALKKSDHDIIDANGHMAMIPCYYAAKKRKKPIIATLHDLYLKEWSSMYNGLGFLLGRPAELFLTKLKYDEILTLNSSLKKSISAINQHSIVKVIQSGIDVKYLRSVRTGKKEKSIIYFGRLVPQKGVNNLIKAMQYVPDYRLKIIGEGYERVKLERLANSLGLKNRVEFLGKIKRHEDVVKKIKKSEIFVLPSRRESFGITIIEAMCSGTAVISTNTEGPRDTITNGENGLLTKIGDHNSLANAINKLIDNPSLRNKIVKNGLKRAKDFDWDKIVKRISHEYRNLAE